MKNRRAQNVLDIQTIRVKKFRRECGLYDVENAKGQSRADKLLGGSRQPQKQR